MAENLQATLFQYAFSAHANNIFQKWTVFVFTESWSHDQLTVDHMINQRKRRPISIANEQGCH